MNEKLHNECRSVENAIEGGVETFLELVLLIFLAQFKEKSVLIKDRAGMRRI